jgi:hypothetical protein
MQEKSKQFLVMLLALTVLLLPIHFVWAVGAHGAGVSGEIIANHSGMTGCGHDQTGNLQDASDCRDNSSCATSVDDCCGGNCSGAQMFLPTAFESHFTYATGFDLVWSQQLPDPIASAEFRPPIVIS